MCVCVCVYIYIYIWAEDPFGNRGYQSRRRGVVAQVGYHSWKLIDFARGINLIKRPIRIQYEIKLGGVEHG